MWVPGLIYTVVSIALWQLMDAVYVPELVTNRIFEMLPVPVIEAGVQRVGAAAKYTAFWLVTAVYFFCYFWFSSAWDRLRPYLGNAFAAGFILWGFHVLILFPAAGAGAFGHRLPQGAFSSSVFLLAAHWIFSRALQFRGFRTAQPAVTRTGRRVFIAAAVVAAAAGLFRLYALYFKPAKWSESITPTEDFYTVSKNSVDPVVTEAEWTLEIGGRDGAAGRSMSLADLRRLPSVTMVATLACISNPVGGPWMGNATWKGVPLSSVLPPVNPRARDVVLRAADGYADSIPVERALHPQCLLAYEMNGAPLTRSHGFPLRLIVPGIYGMKNVKWIRAIEVVDEDFRGFWQTRGWDDAAPYKLMSRIDIAKDGLVAGVAFAGDRGVRSVQVMVGDAPWMEAELEPAMSPFSWVRWSVRADARGKGVMVRMTAADGEAQIAQPRDPFPEGSSGLHTVVGS